MVPANISSQADYSLTWSSIDNGGGTSSGGKYTLSATIAQPESGNNFAEGFELNAGFWGSGPLCLVNFEDFAHFAQYWLDSGPAIPSDINEDGTVDINDLNYFLDYWLWYCPEDWSL